MLKKLFSLTPELVTEEASHFHENKQGLRLNIEEQIEAILESCGLVFRQKEEESPGYLAMANPLSFKEPSLGRAFLRGAYLAYGSMSDPRKAYHWEIVCRDQEQAEEICNLLSLFQLEGRRVQRKNSRVVYLKEGSAIVDVLNIMGAHVALLNLENVRILKEMRNSVNRQVNCETANIQKTVSAAGKQGNDHALIQQTIGLDALRPALQEMARLRLEYPEVPLQELGTMLDPPVGKSGVNHRLRKISAIAEDLRQEKGGVLQ